MSAWKRVLSSPATPPLLLILLGVLIFGPHAAGSGLHWDDHSFHLRLSRANWGDVWAEFLTFVPGRNLHILFQAALYKILGPSVPRQHWFGLALDLLNTVLVYSLGRTMRLSRSWAFLIGGLFLVWPNHSETHFWVLSIVQNRLSTTFLLTAFLWAGTAGMSTGPRAAGTICLYAMGLFIYDQIFFLWPLLLWYAELVPHASLGTKRKLALAGTFLALNIAHVLLRIFVPVSSGGRPVLTLGLFSRGLHDSLVNSLVPIQKLPIWTSLHSWAGGPLPTILLVLAMTSVWLACIAGLRSADERNEEALVPRKAALFGILWFFLSYLPNYFWHISPRHNYLPSFGLLLALTSGALMLLARDERLWKATLGALVFLVFGLSSATDLAEGYAWTMSNALHERFRREVPAVLAANPDNLFLLGAPLTIARVPGIAGPEEAAYLYAEATGHLPRQSGLSLTAGRGGAFFGNETELFGWENLSWRPYEGMNVVVYDRDAGFSCVGKLKVAAEGRPLHSVTLGQPSHCVAETSLEAPLWLESSTQNDDTRSAPLLTAKNGVALIFLTVRGTAPGWAELELVWRPPRGKIADFATAVTLHDGSGRLVYEPVYRTAPKARAFLWPAFNDLEPASAWRTGHLTRELYQVRLASPLPAGPLQARLTLFERAEGPWRRLGTYAVATGTR